MFRIFDKFSPSMIKDGAICDESVGKDKRQIELGCLLSGCCSTVMFDVTSLGALVSIVVDSYVIASITNVITER